MATSCLRGTAASEYSSAAERHISYVEPDAGGKVGSQCRTLSYSGSPAACEHAQKKFWPKLNHEGCGRQAEEARRRRELREIGTAA